MKTEELNIVFEQSAIDEIARISVELNEEDNIGARRLRTVVDAILEDINFEAPDFEIKDCTIVIGGDYVIEKTKNLYVNRDFKKYLMWKEKWSLKWNKKVNLYLTLIKQNNQSTIN